MESMATHNLKRNIIRIFYVVLSHQIRVGWKATLINTNDSVNILNLMDLDNNGVK